MSAEPDHFDALIERFRTLGPADRDAVLATLPPLEREQLVGAIERRLRLHREEAEAARRAGRRYAAYSPWLAEIVRAAATGAPTDALSPAAARAVADAHASIETESEPEPATWWERLRRLGADIVDGKAVAP